MVGRAKETVALIVILFACSLPDGGDYKTAGTGNQAQAALEECRQDRYKPCGWVRACPSMERDNPLGVLELCVLWPDRIGPY
jgi:hypothetical protein